MSRANPPALVGLKLARRHLPRSLIARAIDYTLALWSTLQEYLLDGRLEALAPFVVQALACPRQADNLVEKAIRPTALGKKNWLFIGEAEAGSLT